MCFQKQYPQSIALCFQSAKQTLINPNHSPTEKARIDIPILLTDKEASLVWSVCLLQIPVMMIGKQSQDTTERNTGSPPPPPPESASIPFHYSGFQSSSSPWFSMGPLASSFSMLWSLFSFQCVLHTVFFHLLIKSFRETSALSCCYPLVHWSVKLSIFLLSSIKTAYQEGWIVGLVYSKSCFHTTSQSADSQVTLMGFLHQLVIFFICPPKICTESHIRI